MPLLLRCRCHAGQGSRSCPPHLQPQHSILRCCVSVNGRRASADMTSGTGQPLPRLPRCELCNGAAHLTRCSSDKVGEERQSPKFTWVMVAIPRTDLSFNGCMLDVPQVMSSLYPFEVKLGHDVAGYACDHAALGQLTDVGVQTPHQPEIAPPLLRAQRFVNLLATSHLKSIF